MRATAKDIGPLFACFQHIAKRELFFHSLFFVIGILSAIAFVFFFSFLADSFVMGIFIAFLFFTSVLYFVLRLYYQEQKPVQLQNLRNEYLAQFPQDPTQLAAIATDCAKKLDDAELRFYSLPKSFEFCRPSLEKLWRACHWKDVQLFKELFLRYAVEQNVKLVTESPTEPEPHAELAEAYLTLANLYGSKQQERYVHYCRLALEELQIVTEYAPSDLWVHAKLAETYQALQMTEKAISQYEAILHINPQDVDSLYALGKLYFKQGMHGKGLKVYEKLKQLSTPLAEQLLAAYGTA